MRYIYYKEFNIIVCKCIFLFIYEIFYLYLGVFFFFRYVFFVESSVNIYVGSSFLGLVDGMFEIESSLDEFSRWEIVKKYFIVIFYIIEFVVLMF